MFLNNRRRQAALWTLLASLALASAEVGSPAWAHDDSDSDSDSDRVQIVEPGGSVFGKSYNDLAGEWWNWGLAEPAETNAILDPTGDFCDLNQKGKVWFLAGSFAGTGVQNRYCKIPKGKAIFFPIVNSLTYAPDFPDPGQNPDCLQLEGVLDQLRCDLYTDFANFGINPQNVVLEVTINGEPVEDLFAYRAQSRPGGHKQLIPENNVFGEDPGPRFPAVADGYWMLLKPLPPGTHEILIRAFFTLFQLELGAHYTLEVRGRRHKRHGHGHDHD